MLLSYFLKIQKIAKFIIAICIVFYLYQNVNAKENNMKGPKNPEQNYSMKNESSFTKLIFGSLVKFYSKVISPLDGPRSPSYPTGSAYGLKAIQQEGAFLGILLIGDRLFHEADKNQGSYITIYGTKRYYDPIENNIFWWKK